MGSGAYPLTPLQGVHLIRSAPLLSPSLLNRFYHDVVSLTLNSPPHFAPFLCFLLQLKNSKDLIYAH